MNYYALLHKVEPLPGQVVDAYVLSVRDDGKINVSLRPVGYDKVKSAQAQVLALLESSDYGGVLPVGDKSTPVQVLTSGFVPIPTPSDGPILTPSIMY